MRLPGPPDLPEFMTWEELELLPDEIAGEIELWNGRVVWARRGPAEHQDYSTELRNSLRRCVRQFIDERPDKCWKVTTETNVFFGQTGKSDFVTPDFMIYRCLPEPYQLVRGADALLVGEVLSPSNRETDIEGKKAKYAEAGIQWYWEVGLSRVPEQVHGIDIVRAYGLSGESGHLPDGVRPLHPANYILIDEWSPKDTEGIRIEFPFPIEIPWPDLVP
ncbi:Uma2 family endonuclease [Nocardia yamanashiensis]|uniref:Uma2 family endonuclease n=1 Tax=Nocardia yamanashiensis TaxID=209247 RepID=UPI001F349325|nr:Uma2 family endonuclease [Nocardia yamanashiensis]